MFDYRTEIREPGTGKIAHTQHYRCRISNDEGTWQLRDGKYYDPQGNVIPTPPSELKKAKAAEVQSPAPKKAETIAKLT